MFKTVKPGRKVSKSQINIKKTDIHGNIKQIS